MPNPPGDDSTIPETDKKALIQLRLKSCTERQICHDENYIVKYIKTETSLSNKEVNFYLFTIIGGLVAVVLLFVIPSLFYLLYDTIRRNRLSANQEAASSYSNVASSHKSKDSPISNVFGRSTESEMKHSTVRTGIPPNSQQVKEKSRSNSKSKRSTLKKLSLKPQQKLPLFTTG